MNSKQEFSGNINSLFNAVNEGNAPHAILIEGEEDKSLENAAVKLSSLFLCISDGEKPCGVCKSCKKVYNGVHPDFKFILGNEKTQSIGVEEIRSVRNDSYIKPNESEYKIYVFKKSQKMTQQSQNALLKILEEPPKSSIFILLCDSSMSMLDTIRSRVQVFRVDSDINITGGKPYEIACDMVLSLISQKEFDLLKISGVILKEKHLLIDIIINLKSILSRACIIQLSHKIDYESQDACNLAASKIYHLRLLRAIDEINTIIEMTDRNVNKNLLINYLCIGLREAALF